MSLNLKIERDHIVSEASELGHKMNQQFEFKWIWQNWHNDFTKLPQWFGKIDTMVCQNCHNHCHFLGNVCSNCHNLLVSRNLYNRG
jgi:hypothetical protein